MTFKYERIVHLFREGWTREQVAQEMGVCMESMGMVISRARRWLGEDLPGHGARQDCTAHVKEQYDSQIQEIRRLAKSGKGSLEIAEILKLSRPVLRCALKRIAADYHEAIPLPVSRRGKGTSNYHDPYDDETRAEARARRDRDVAEGRRCARCYAPNGGVTCGPCSTTGDFALSRASSWIDRAEPLDQ